MMTKTKIPLHPWLIHAGDLANNPPRPMIIDDVIEAIETYSPDYMHGIPKRKYIRCLEKLRDLAGTV